MSIKLRGNRVAIEKVKKQAKSKEAVFLHIPDSEEYLGIIRYVGETASPDLRVGQKVYFSTNHQLVRIQGVDVCMMEDTQVYAITE